MLEGRINIGFQRLRIGLAIVIIMVADLCRDGEAGRHGQAEIGHFGEIGAFATQEILHPRFAFRLAVTEGIDPLCHPGPRVLCRPVLLPADQPSSCAVLADRRTFCNAAIGLTPMNRC